MSRLEVAERLKASGLYEHVRQRLVKPEHGTFKVIPKEWIHPYGWMGYPTPPPETMTYTEGGNGPSNCGLLVANFPWPSFNESQAKLDSLGLQVVSIEGECFLVQEDGASITGSGIILRFKKIAELGEITKGDLANNTALVWLWENEAMVKN